jgi:hypothetical protein
MIRQRITLTIDSVTIEGARLSERALTCAIEAALAERMAEEVEVPLRPDAAAFERLQAKARLAGTEPGPAASVGRAVVDATLGVLGR